MKHRIAIAGFRHAHIFDLYRRAEEHPRLELTSICEENIVKSLLSSKNLKPDFTSYTRMLAKADCDIVGIGDTFGNRGAMVIEALEAGKHVVADKPMCTSLDELQAISSLATKKGLSVGMMLSMRNRGNFITMREIIHSGRIGDVQTMTITGQHPLRYGKRPDWYFEKGKHGGTFNDIGIHAIDLIPWLTGFDITHITSARSWNAKASFAPHFKDCAQCMLELENGAGVLGDFSYLAPDLCGPSLEPYWRTSVHGTHGFIETCFRDSMVKVADDTNEELEIFAPDTDKQGSYLDDFLNEIDGNALQGSLTTESCLKTARTTLRIESLAQTQGKHD